MLPHMVVPCEVYVQVCTVFPVVRLIPSLFSLSTLSLHIYIYILVLIRCSSITRCCGSQRGWCLGDLKIWLGPLDKNSTPFDQPNPFILGPQISTVTNGCTIDQTAQSI
eukprot:TRINITY_DN11125_c3_g1_i1.p1 TRINITY_DN11125_c3_g1~~TRINITY_DN11125_c3_g1_i1.p1  ORF type:complete len:109 (+),score=4.61 TRINITY_DN11125_c3_g1_i1:149-475(+)